MAASRIPSIAGTPVGLGKSILTVGDGADFSTVAAALAYIGSQSSFVVDAKAPTATISAWPTKTSTLTVSALSGTYTGIDPSVRYWFKCAGDTHYYPMAGSSNLAVGSGTVYSQINRIESDLVASKTLTFYREKNWTILIVDPYYTETLDQTSLATAMSVTITSLNGSVVDIAKSGNSTWTDGRIRFQNVILHHNGQNPLFSTPSFSTLIFDAYATELSSSQADLWSPTCYFGAVTMEYCRANSFYNSNRGHMFNVLSYGDQTYRNITWNVINSAAVANAVASNAFFIDRFHARNIVLDNVKGFLRDPHGDFGYAALVGSGDAPTGVGSAAMADYIQINDCSLTLRDSATATMKLNVLSLADGAGMNLGPITAGVTGGIVDINNSLVMAPRGTSTRKLVEAAANPTNAITVYHGVNPLAQTKDAQANITYTAMT